MRRIKVLHLILTLSSGGAQRQLVNLVRSTSKESFDHVVCAIRDASFFAQDIRDAGFRVTEFGIESKHSFFKTASKFRRVISDERPDIIHSWLYDANIAARLAAITFGKTPIITSLQLADYEPEAARIGNWNPHKVRVLKAIDKFTGLLAKPHFVACSEFVKRSYQRHYGLNDAATSVIFNSVDPAGFLGTARPHDELRAELDLPRDAFIYLNVGRLDPQKNHRVLFEAFRKVAVDLPNAYLLLAGIGGLEAELMKLAEDLAIGSRVLFLGRRDDVGALLDLADVFVFPSFFEGLPVALVEAMLFSLPCIASRIEVFEEVIEDNVNGLLVDPNSASELAKAMIRLYKDEDLRHSLGQSAFTAAKRSFHTDQTGRQWEGLYSQIASQKGI